MNRAGIIAANPLPDYLRNRGFSLHPAGSNFVTNACPLKEHQKSHRCVTIDTAQGLWHCNDHERGGTIIDWEALEKRSNRPKRCDNSASDLTERIRRQPGGKSPQRIATPTKRANCFSNACGSSPKTFGSDDRMMPADGSGISKASRAFFIGCPMC